MQRYIFLGGCICMLLFATAQHAFADDAKVISVAEAMHQVDKDVAVEMTVKSSRLLDSGAFCFLNSAKSFQEKSNFTIAIPGDALPKFADLGIDDPAVHFQDKTIRVFGKVTLYKDRPQILVNDPKRIVVITKIETPPK